MGENGKRIGLALSGGGYRAAAYHLGTLRALHKMGLLEKVMLYLPYREGLLLLHFTCCIKTNLLNRLSNPSVSV